MGWARKLFVMNPCHMSPRSCGPRWRRPAKMDRMRKQMMPTALCPSFSSVKDAGASLETTLPGSLLTRIWKPSLYEVLYVGNIPGTKPVVSPLRASRFANSLRRSYKLVHQRLEVSVGELNVGKTTRLACGSCVPNNRELCSAVVSG